MVKGPLKWFGGKGKMLKKLLPFTEVEHRTYVEVFGGGAAVLFNKLPSPVEVYNDLDGSLVDFYRVLIDPELFKQFYRMVQVTPYSRELYNEYRETWQAEMDQVKRVYKWYCMARWSISGRHHGWGYVRSASNRGMAESCSTWLSVIDKLPEFHDRVSRVQIEHADFRDIIKNYDSPDTLFYLDPPYMHETRKDIRYKKEMTLEDHKELLDVIQGIQGKAFLSGYPSELYDTMLASWNRSEWQTSSHAAGRTRGTGILGPGSATRMQKRTEIVWYNWNQPLLEWAEKNG